MFSETKNKKNTFDNKKLFLLFYVIFTNFLRVVLKNNYTNM